MIHSSLGKCQYTTGPTGWLNVPKTEAPGSSVTVSLPALIMSLPGHDQNILPVLGIRAEDVRVDLLLCRVGAHAKDTILALKPYPHAGFQELFNGRGQSDRR